LSSLTALSHPLFWSPLMNALGEAAVGLPLILPCASSLVRLTRPDAASVWSEVRFDPGCVLLLARSVSIESSPHSSLPTPHSFPLTSLLQGTSVLEKALTWLNQGDNHFVDWNQPGLDHIQRI